MSTVPSSTTISPSQSSTPSSRMSTSTAGGSPNQENGSSQATLSSPSRFAVILVSVLLIFPEMALLNGVYMLDGGLAVLSLLVRKAFAGLTLPCRER